MKRFRCKTCGNETEFTICSNNIEELPVIANKV